MWIDFKIRLNSEMVVTSVPTGDTIHLFTLPEIVINISPHLGCPFYY